MSRVLGREPRTAALPCSAASRCGSTGCVAGPRIGGTINGTTRDADLSPRPVSRKGHGCKSRELRAEITNLRYRRKISGGIVDKRPRVDSDQREGDGVDHKFEWLEQRTTTPDGVYRTLRAAILDGTVPPGGQLREAHIAADLGISRSPLREALSKLEEEGLVVKIPLPWGVRRRGERSRGRRDRLGPATCRAVRR